VTTALDPVASAPVAATGTLVGRRATGAYHVLTVAAPDIVATAVPGQFVSVEVGARGALLRRPFAIAGVDIPAGLLEVVVAVVGRGSAWLVERPVSTSLELTGPLGTGFAVPAAPSRCLLVGGGYGVAALAWLAGGLRAAGHTVELLSGARSAFALYPVPALERGIAADVDGPADRPFTLDEATEDGSRGRTGLVTDVLSERLGEGERQRAGGRGMVGEGERQRAGGRGLTTVFACGPMPMLAAVARIADEHGCPCQVAVEEHMGCSIGVCMTCVVPTDRGYVRACIDGPVLDAGLVDWSQVGL
jgi:dihydroorotate dehydrogenase electron transfer subunit